MRPLPPTPQDSSTHLSTSERAYRSGTLFRHKESKHSNVVVGCASHARLPRHTTSPHRRTQLLICTHGHRVNGTCCSSIGSHAASRTSSGRGCPTRTRSAIALGSASQVRILVMCAAAVAGVRQHALHSVSCNTPDRCTSLRPRWTRPCARWRCARDGLSARATRTQCPASRSMSDAVDTQRTHPSPPMHVAAQGMYTAEKRIRAIDLQQSEPAGVRPRHGDLLEASAAAV